MVIAPRCPKHHGDQNLTEQCIQHTDQHNHVRSQQSKTMLHIQNHGVGTTMLVLIIKEVNILCPRNWDATLSPALLYSLQNFQSYPTSIISAKVNISFSHGDAYHKTALKERN